MISSTLIRSALLPSLELALYGTLENKAGCIVKRAPTKKNSRRNAHLITESSHKPSTAQHYQRIVRWGNGGMLLSLLLVIVTVLVAYISPESFSIGIQVMAHIVMLLAVTALKITYLIRCVGRHGLGARQL